MSFNGNGGFNLPLSPVTNGTTIESVWADTTLNDIAAGLSSCLVRDGQSPMTGSLRLAAGTVESPAITWNSETSTGLFQPEPLSIAFSVAATEVGRFINGNFLIGTTADSGEKLNVAGTSRLQGNVNITTGGLNVTGLSTLTGAATVSAGLTVGTGVTITAGGATITGDSSVTGTLTATALSGPLTGNASTATTLQTPRTIALSGGATGTATSFNGSADISIDVTALNATNLTAGVIPNGRLSGSYTGITSITSTGFTGALTGNASTATALQTARTIAISGDATGTATSFNGTANISIPITGLNASGLDSGTVPDARISGAYSGITTLTVTSGLLPPAGSDATPSIRFSDDTNTGIFRSNTDQIGFATAGVQRLYINTTAVTSLLPIVSDTTARAWVKFNAVTGTPAINDDYNISSITDLAIGTYRLNFSAALPNANYAAICTTVLTVEQAPRFMGASAQTTTTCTVEVEGISGNHDDFDSNAVVIFGG